MKTQTSKVTTALLIAALPAFSLGATGDPEFSYTYLQGGYVDTELDDSNIDGDGVEVKGSIELNANVFALADYRNQDFDFGIDADRWQLGLGAHTPLNQSIDLVGKVSYVDVDIDSAFGSADGNGFGVGVGLRGRVNPALELEAGIDHTDLDGGDETALVVGGRYYITEALAAGAEYSNGDDTSTWGLNLRYEFD